MKTKSQKLIKKCDKSWALIIKTRAGYQCEKCGRTQSQIMMNAAHIIRRGNKSTRWDLRNGLCLCVGCHYWLDKTAEHIEAVDFLTEKIGKELLDELTKLGRQSKHYLTYDLEILLKELEEREASLINE